MQKKKNKKQNKIKPQYVFYLVAMVTGIIMGLVYVDKPEKEVRNVNYVNYPPQVKHDTIVIHDTIYKDRPVVRWKVKKCCCCCCRRLYFGCDLLNNDTINIQ